MRPTISPEDWQRLDWLFAEAAALPEDQRADWLDQHCPDPVLRAELEDLLAHSGTSDREELGRIVAEVGFALAADPDPAQRWIGQQFGAWRVERIAGRGGMGVVYEVSRTEGGFAQRGALKLMHGGPAQADLWRRFAQERAILARLEHPGVARLLDGGSSADGQPWLVMEFVDGQPLTAFANSRLLSVTDRVRLFVRICEAMEFAHRNLIVHRDLKPANILVTADGSPKLLDFGIARLMEAGGDSQATATVATFLTPDYAAPEQVLGQAITTVTDVYGLGAVLYELLTGVRPHSIREYTPAGVAEAITQVDPVRPSTATPDRERGRVLSGDLDNIVLKALRKEPERRYQSVGELSADLQRYLADQPVSARPETIGYVTRKWLRRNRTAAIAGLLVVLSLAGGLGVSVVSQQQAQRRFGEVRSLARKILFDLDAELRTVAGTTKARGILVKILAEYLDSLAHEAGSDPDLRAELAEGYLRIAEVQGDIFDSAHVGEVQGALSSLNKAIGVAKGADPGRAVLVRGYANSHIANILLFRGQRVEALAHCQRVRQEKDALIVTPMGARIYASELNREGDLLSLGGDLQGARRLFTEARTAMTQARSRETVVSQWQIRLGLVREALVLRSLGEFEGARRLLESILEPGIAPPKDSRDGNAQFNRTMVLLDLARVYFDPIGPALNRPDLAETVAREAVNELTGLLRLDANNRQVEWKLAEAHGILGAILRERGDRGAPALLAKARAELDRAVAASGAEAPPDLLLPCVMLGQDDPDAAERALGLMLRRDPDLAEPLQLMALVRIWQADAFARVGRSSQAAAALADAGARVEALAARFPDYARIAWLQRKIADR